MPTAPQGSSLPLHDVPSVWDDPCTQGWQNDLRDVIRSWPDDPTVTVDPAHATRFDDLGDALESRYRALYAAALRAPTPPSSSWPTPTSGVRWSFLNAPMRSRSGIDQGLCKTEHAFDLWQHPLMTAVRYGGLAIIALIMDRGRMRPAAGRASDHAHVHEVAAVLGHRGLPGGLAVLQRYETDPAVQGRQAMLWIGTAVASHRDAAIGQARPWFDPQHTAAPPFECPMDQLLTPQAPPGVGETLPTPAMLRSTLNAMLELAPWDRWRHQDADETPVPFTEEDWLNQVVLHGADWAFDTLFPRVCPSAATLDRWAAGWAGQDPDFDLVDTTVARHSMGVRLADHLLRTDLPCNTPSPDHQAPRRRL